MTGELFDSNLEDFMNDIRKLLMEKLRRREWDIAREIELEGKRHEQTL